MYIIFTCIATPPLAMKCAHKLSYCINNDTYYEFHRHTRTTKPAAWRWKISQTY